MSDRTGGGPLRPLRIVLADDHPVVRRGLSRVLEGEGFEIVAEAAEIETARRHVRELRPDVLVLDLNMPGGSSLDAVAQLREECPETQIVILTMQSEPAYARRALSDGALGYVLKEAADAELVEAIRLAAAGERYLNPRLGARLAADAAPAASEALSERELAVVRLVALGHTNTEIADELFVSVRTVETHRAHIQQKLRMRSRSDLVRYALQHGLIETW